LKVMDINYGVRCEVSGVGNARADT